MLLAGQMQRELSLFLLPPIHSIPFLIAIDLKLGALGQEVGTRCGLQLLGAPTTIANMGAAGGEKYDYENNNNNYDGDQNQMQDQAGGYDDQQQQGGGHFEDNNGGGGGGSGGGGSGGGSGAARVTGFPDVSANFSVEVSMCSIERGLLQRAI
jgi:uncharacterized membrane protein YgcG